MINIGMWNELTVLRQKDFGIYLGEKATERASCGMAGEIHRRSLRRQRYCFRRSRSRRVQSPEIP